MTNLVCCDALFKLQMFNHPRQIAQVNVLGQAANWESQCLDCNKTLMFAGVNCFLIP